MELRPYVVADQDAIVRCYEALRSNTTDVGGGWGYIMIAVTHLPCSEQCCPF